MQEAECRERDERDAVRAADVPRDRAAAESQGEIGDDYGKVPAALEQRAPGSIDQLGRRGRWQSEPVDDELGVPAESAVRLAQVLGQVRRRSWPSPPPAGRARRARPA